MEQGISCPVDLVTIHDKQPRIVAGFVVLIAVLYLLMHTYWLPVFLVVDFFLRSFKLNKYSPLGNLTGWIVKEFKINGKKADVAPKRFAAKLGLVLTILIVGLRLLGYPTISYYLSYVLLIFALLESVFGICVGCKIYQVWITFKYR